MSLSRRGFLQSAAASIAVASAGTADRRMGANAYVSNWYSMSDGNASVIGGFFKELVEALCRNKQATPTATANYQAGKIIGSVCFSQEALKLLFDKPCADARVEVRYFTRVIDADADPRTGRVRGVITSNIEGYRYRGRCVPARSWLNSGFCAEAFARVGCGRFGQVDRTLTRTGVRPIARRI